MPSKSDKQHRFMAMCSTGKSRKRTRGKCPSKKVAREYLKADKGKRFKK